MVRAAESGFPIHPVYHDADVRPGLAERLGEPGEFPFTRGVYPTMYTERPWTMRQYAGFGNARESNARYHQLLPAEQGVPGFDLNGTIQNDVLKEYIARGTYIFPPSASLRLVTDTFAY